jgi:hypothetical protein
MSTKVIASIIFALFIILLVGGVYYFRPSLFGFEKTKEQTPVAEEEPVGNATPTPASEMKVDRIKIIEDAISGLKKDQEDQDSLITDLSEKVNDLSTASATLSTKTILDTQESQGSTFTTASTGYTQMNMFDNITCSKACVLWINFYTSTKNDSSNLNTYGLFINGQDKGIYSQASITNANSAVPLSFNASIPAGSGSYTVEIKAKTSGGTLQSDISFLQIMAIEQ